MEEDIPKVYDGIDYDLEQVIVAINSLRKAKDIAEKNLDSVVSIENYDDKQIDEDEENKEIKKATREKYENYKKNANKLSGKEGKGLISGIDGTLNRAINIRNAILRANGISEDLYEEYSHNIISNLTNATELHDGEFGDFLIQNNNEYSNNSYSNELNIVNTNYQSDELIIDLDNENAKDNNSSLTDEFSDNEESQLLKADLSVDSESVNIEFLNLNNSTEDDTIITNDTDSKELNVYNINSKDLQDNQIIQSDSNNE